MTTKAKLADKLTNHTVHVSHWQHTKDIAIWFDMWFNFSCCPGEITTHRAVTKHDSF